MDNRLSSLELAVATLLLAKAKSEDVSGLYDLAWNNAAYGDEGQWQRSEIAQFAGDHGHTHLLPTAAHETLHRLGISHNHEGVTNDEDGNHEHLVQKAFSSSALTMKSWTNDNGLLVIEGWVSTPDVDLDKDIVPPEAFTDSLEGYISRGAPLSSEHNTRNYPVGHGQHIALVRDGQIFKAAQHPTDAAEFEHFPQSGTGVYGRFAITEPEAMGAVRKGNVRGFSWIGKPVETEPLSSGGRFFKVVNPWFESTIAAYPINGRAVMTAAA